MSDTKHITFIDNPAVKTKKDQYLNIDIDVSLVLESWKNSLFSYEWLNEAGEIKPLSELSETEQAKRQKVEKAMAEGNALEKPILGIGILDNVEIGSGRAELMVTAASGLKTIPVHIPVSNEEDFKSFRV